MELFFKSGILLCDFFHDPPLLEDALTPLELDRDRGPVESEEFADLILYVTRVGEMEMVRVVDRDEEFRRIGAHLRSVIDLRFMGFLVPGGRMLVDDLLEEGVEHGSLHALQSLLLDAHRRFQNVFKAFPCHRGGEDRCDEGEELEFLLEVSHILVHDRILVDGRLRKDLVPLVDDEDDPLLRFERP